MKLSQVKQLPVILEGTASLIQAKELSNSKVINRIAQDVESLGFPESFELTLATGGGAKIPVKFELDDKTINHEASFHTITFKYELSTASHKAIDAHLKKLEGADDDEEGERYDAEYDELKHDSIYVMVDLRKGIEKVWGSTK